MNARPIETTESDQCSGDVDRYVVVHHVREACPRCGSTQRTKKTRATTEKQASTYQGESFTHVQRSQTSCSECGQKYLLIEYLREKDAMRPKDQQTTTADPPAGGNSA